MLAAPVPDHLIKRHRADARRQQNEQEDDHQIGLDGKSERKQPRDDEPWRAGHGGKRYRAENGVADGAAARRNQDRGAPESTAPQGDGDQDRNAERAGEKIDQRKSRALRQPDPSRQGDIRDWIMMKMTIIPP